MSIFKRKRHDNALESLGKTIESHDPHQNLRTVGYHEPKAASLFRRWQRIQSKSFLKNTSPDLFNKTYEDSLIRATGEQGMAELDMHHSNNIRCIEQFIIPLRKGDSVLYGKRKEQLGTEREMRIRELNKLLAIYHENTSMEGNTVERSSY